MCRCQNCPPTSSQPCIPTAPPRPGPAARCSMPAAVASATTATRAGSRRSPRRTAAVSGSAAVAGGDRATTLCCFIVCSSVMPISLASAGKSCLRSLPGYHCCPSPYTFSVCSTNLYTHHHSLALILSCFTVKHCPASGDGWRDYTVGLVACKCRRLRRMHPDCGHMRNSTKEAQLGGPNLCSTSVH